ncbi:MAG: hypothetical protein H6632_13010 [Anaerolineales bacterium]|nr:hypothetical protein [Anaerolineales bacterium]
MPQFLSFMARFSGNSECDAALIHFRPGWRKSIGWALPLTIFGPLLMMLVVFSTVLINRRTWPLKASSTIDLRAVIGRADRRFATRIALALAQSVDISLSERTVGLGCGAGDGLLDSIANHNGSTSTVRFAIGRKIRTHSVVGLGLPLAVEFIYLRDNFGIRMDTIFKFYFSKPGCNWRWPQPLPFIMPQ